MNARGMNATREIIVIGAGGHARVLIDILRQMGLTPAAAVDANPALHHTTLDDVPVIGGDDSVFARACASVILVNGQGNVPRIGASGLARRRNVYAKFVGGGYTFMSVVSPDAYISPQAIIGVGAQILTRAIIHPGAKVGVNTIVNTCAQLDHDCVVGDHSHVAPGTILCGGVVIGDECHVGASAVVAPGIKIGAGAVAGAGAVVTRDVAPGETVLAPHTAGKSRPAVD